MKNRSLVSEVSRTLVVIVGAMLPMMGFVLFVGVASAQPPTPAPRPLPPGWTLTEIPAIGYSEYPTALATSWCEGTTRVHVLTTTSGDSGQDLEVNARTCGGTA